MGKSAMYAWLLASAGLGLLPLPGARSQDGEMAARFAAPVRISAGDAFLGAGRLYPSPVLQDLDGDGDLDIVVGDLMGKVTMALHENDTKSLALAAEKPLPNWKGDPLKFHNW